MPARRTSGHRPAESTGALQGRAWHTRPMAEAHDPGDPDGPPSFFAVALRQRACRRFADRPVDDTLIERCLTAAIHGPRPRRTCSRGSSSSSETTGNVRRSPTSPVGSGGKPVGPRPRDASHPDCSTRWTPGPRRAWPVRRSSWSCAGTRRWPTGPPCRPRSTRPPRTCCWRPTPSDSARRSPPWPPLDAHVLSDVLGLPDQVHPMAVVPLGWPARPPGPPRRRPVDQVTHRDRFGIAWT